MLQLFYNHRLLKKYLNGKGVSGVMIPTERKPFANKKIDRKILIVFVYLNQILIYILIYRMRGFLYNENTIDF